MTVCFLAVFGLVIGDAQPLPSDPRHLDPQSSHCGNGDQLDHSHLLCHRRQRSHPGRTSAVDGVLNALRYNISRECVAGKPWPGWRGGKEGDVWPIPRGGHAPTTTMPFVAEATCELLMANSDQCGIWNGTEALEQCVKRIGITPWTKGMHPKCTRSPLWKKLQQKLWPGETEEQKVVDARVLRNRIFDASTPKRYPYVPPARRTFAKFPSPSQCSFGPMFRFGFSISSSMIAKRVPPVKTWDFAPVLPSPMGTLSAAKVTRKDPKYVFGPFDEEVAAEIYSQSYFAFTMRRNGIDCGRHLEILSSGAVPYWADIHLIPEWAAPQYPKHLLKEALDLPGVEHIGRASPKGPVETEYLANLAFSDWTNFKKPGTINWTTFNTTRYKDLASRLLDYTRKHLSCSAMVAYLLKSIGVEEPKSVLLVNTWHMDYAGTPVECGLSELGLNYTTLLRDEWPDDQSFWERPEAARSDPEYSAERHETLLRYRKTDDRYGHGYLWTMRINAPPNPRLTIQAAQEALRNRQFDLVIYPSFPLEKSFLEEAVRNMPAKSIVLIDVNDDVRAESVEIAAKFAESVHFFVREASPGVLQPYNCVD